jgi:hypothetical protein
MASAEATLPFYNKLQKVERQPKESLLAQIKRFQEETDGGAIPPALAAVGLGVSRQRVAELINKGKLRAWSFNGKPLVSVKDIDAYDEARKKEANYKGLLRKKA